MIAQADKTQPQTKSNNKSIFDRNFTYLKIPREVFDIEGLNCAERMILARIIFWTRKGLACRETNKQLGELISMCPDVARRAVYKLIKMKLVDAYYVNVKERRQRNGYRDLTALVAVDGEMILKRKAAQSSQNMGRTVKFWPENSSEVVNSETKAKDNCTMVQPSHTPCAEDPKSMGHLSQHEQHGTDIPTTTNTTEATKRYRKKMATRPKRNRVLSDDEFERRRQYNHRILQAAIMSQEGG